MVKVCCSIVRLLLADNMATSWSSTVEESHRSASFWHLCTPKSHSATLWGALPSRPSPATPPHVAPLPSLSLRPRAPKARGAEQILGGSANPKPRAFGDRSAFCGGFVGWERGGNSLEDAISIDFPDKVQSIMCVSLFSEAFVLFRKALSLVMAGRRTEGIYTDQVVWLKRGHCRFRLVFVEL